MKNKIWIAILAMSGIILLIVSFGNYIPMANGEDDYSYLHDSQYYNYTLEEPFAYSRGGAWLNPSGLGLYGQGYPMQNYVLANYGMSAYALGYPFRNYVLSGYGQGYPMQNYVLANYGMSAYTLGYPFRNYVLSGYGQGYPMQNYVLANYGYGLGLGLGGFGGFI